MVMTAASFAAGLAIGPIGGGGGNTNSVTVFNDELVTMTSTVLNGADEVHFDVLNADSQVVYSGVSPVQDGQASFTWIPLFDGTFTVNAESYLQGSMLSTELVSFGQVVRPDASGFITGGGWYQANGARDTFGFVAQVLGNGTIRGNLEFQDHSGYNIKSTMVDWVYSPNLRDGYFTGYCKLNGAGNYRFMVHVIDNGEPGTNDWLELWVYDPVTGALLYQYQNTLSGGNVQVKKK